VSVSSGKSVSDLSIAVVGFGSIGNRHLENLGRLGVTRRTIVRRATGANSAFDPPPGVAVVHSAGEAIRHGLDAAIICNPTAMHVDTATEYLSAGVAVLIEKPVSHRLEEAERLLELARRKTAPAGMAYVMRYHPAYRVARQLVSDGRLGRVLYAKAWFEAYLPDWHPWEDYRQSYAARKDLGGGVLPTLDHELDFLNWCFAASELTQGWSGRSGALEIDADDWATVFIRYPGGIAANCMFSLCRSDRHRGFEIVGEQVTLSFSFETGKLTELRGAKSQTLWEGAAYDLNDAYLAMLKDALEAVANRRPFPIGLDAGVQALRIAAGVRSLGPAP
jgi:predicted dehydrogenase